MKWKHALIHGFTDFESGINWNMHAQIARKNGINESAWHVLIGLVMQSVFTLPLNEITAWVEAPKSTV